MKKSRKKKLRKLGDILLDIEPLYRELMLDHGLQYSDLYGLIDGYNKAHGMDEHCLEHYNDGTTAVTYHGHKSGLKK